MAGLSPLPGFEAINHYEELQKANI
jgi:hypothetical protein